MVIIEKLAKNIFLLIFKEYFKKGVKTRV